LFLFLLSKIFPKKIRYFLIGAAIIGFFVCLWGSYNRGAFTFYSMPTRVWELLLGSFLASAGFSIFTRASEDNALLMRLGGQRIRSRALCEVFGWFDEDHLSDAGAQEMRPVFEQVFTPSQAASRSQCPSRMPSPANALRTSLPTNGAAALAAESPP
jgi:hypothetical protein